MILMSALPGGDIQVRRSKLVNPFLTPLDFDYLFRCLAVLMPSSRLEIPPRLPGCQVWQALCVGRGVRLLTTVGEIQELRVCLFIWRHHVDEWHDTDFIS